MAMIIEDEDESVRVQRLMIDAGVAVVDDLLPE
jgi:hypothetical protein